MTQLELLAPAKNLECGIAAIDHGADAVYIGASRFGARAAAGNSVDDIARLCRYAHQFGAKVYVTVNTILFDHEIDDTRHLVSQLRKAGVDALLVQDMSLISGLSPVELGAQKASPTIGGWSGLPLHASTQTDNRTAGKVSWLHSIGFDRVVLARELSLEEIAQIHREVPDVELEVFVHGALCVSYSGQCYMSQYCLGRSANRGECAQMCRMRYDLVDAAGHEIEHQRYLLSLRDLCRIDALEQLADAGAVSFKIEGRLKDVDYVKNVVAAYSQQLDGLCQRRAADYVRASRGHVEYTFKPDLQKTFNRGFTDYFLHCHRNEHGMLEGRKTDVASFDTPKALGEYVGRVKEVRHHSFTVAGTAAFANGDGLCFFLPDGKQGQELVGFRVNRADGNQLFPLKMPRGLKPGMGLYRNNDVAFERILAGTTAVRRIPVAMQLAPDTATDGSQELSLTVDAGFARVRVAIAAQLAEQARKPQGEFIARELSKLGDTPYICGSVEVAEGFTAFVTASQLSQLRRMAVGALASQADASRRQQSRHVGERPSEQQSVPPYPASYLYNVSNREACAFYEGQNLSRVEPAFELQEPTNPILMQCRHCLRFSLGYCEKHGGRRPSWHEPLFLRLGDGRRFRLAFDCRQCQMNIYPAE